MYASAGINFLFTIALQRRSFAGQCRIQSRNGAFPAPLREHEGTSGQDGMRPALRCLIGVLALAATASAPARAEYRRAGARPSHSYVVDFRARPGGVFGHTYVVYGRVDARGRIVRPRYAGLYPGGPFSQTALLALLAVPGKITVRPIDHERTPKMIYRRRLSPTAYARLSRAVRIRQTTPQAWDLLLNNCNSFAAEIAAAIGLRTPPTIEFPDDFVRDLFVMNRAPRATHRRMHASRPRRPVRRPVYERDALYHYDSETRRVTMWR